MQSSQNENKEHSQKVECKQESSQNEDDVQLTEDPSIQVDDVPTQVIHAFPFVVAYQLLYFH